MKFCVCLLFCTRTMKFARCGICAAYVERTALASSIRLLCCVQKCFMAVFPLRSRIVNSQPSVFAVSELKSFANAVRLASNFIEDPNEQTDRHEESNLVHCSFKM